MKNLNFVLLGALILLSVPTLSGCFGTIEVGERGVKVAQGVVSPNLLKEGFYTYNPFLERVEDFVIRQTTVALETQVQTRDMQTVSMDLSVTYKIPDVSVIPIFKDYQGDAFETLLKPKLLDALKSSASKFTAYELISKRDIVRENTLLGLRDKIDGLILVESLMFTGTKFSEKLQEAIEEKQKAEIEEATARNRVNVERANAQALTLRAKALRSNPALIQEKFLEKWDGKMPQVMGNGSTLTQIMPK
jgi:prohibitin 2